MPAAQLSEKAKAWARRAVGEGEGEGGEGGVTQGRPGKPPHGGRAKQSMNAAVTDYSTREAPVTQHTTIGVCAGQTVCYYGPGSPTDWLGTS